MVLKGRLARAKKKGALETIGECQSALTEFEVDGYPDSWHRWQVALRDAESQLIREMNAEWDWRQRERSS